MYLGEKDALGMIAGGHSCVAYTYKKSKIPETKWLET